MGQFLAEEKNRQAKFKKEWPGFSPGARHEGMFFGNERPFCLPPQYAEQNLFPEIRGPITHYFADKHIKWHGGMQPSNHLCDSQICCANFFFPFADRPAALAQLLKPVFPQIAQMLPIEDDQYVALEWIGDTDYLGEMEGRRNKIRNRGANCTSADAAVRFRSQDGSVQVVLIEWKYCESYSSRSYKIAGRSGKNRVDIYRKLLEAQDCPIDTGKLKSLDDLFYEPFYQLMRQQLLANAMEQAMEKGATQVTLLHIAPHHNLDFRRVTSPNLEGLGESPTAVWKKLVRPADRFVSVYTEDLFGHFQAETFPELRPWREYIDQRYPWVRDPAL